MDRSAFLALLDAPLALLGIMLTVELVLLDLLKSLSLMEMEELSLSALTTQTSLVLVPSLILTF